jgi:hypothetical protein
LSSTYSSRNKYTADAFGAAGSEVIFNSSGVGWVQLDHPNAEADAMKERDAKRRVRRIVVTKAEPHKWSVGKIPGGFPGIRNDAFRGGM